VVLAVIGALAVGVSLSVRAAQAGSDLRRASEDLEVFMASAQAQAAVSSAPIVVTFRRGASAVRLRRIGGDGSELSHALPGGVRIDRLGRGEAARSDRALRLTIQPSGYVRGFTVGLAQGERRLWVRWDPADDPGWSAKAPSEVGW